MAVRSWIGVQDLFAYARANFRRPSGIQRLAFEISRKLEARYSSTGLVCFVRHPLTGNGSHVVEWSEVATLFVGLANGDTAPVSRPVDGPVFPHVPARQFVRRLAYRLSPSLRPCAVDALLTQARALRAWGRLIPALARGAARLLHGSGTPNVADRPAEMETVPQHGCTRWHNTAGQGNRSKTSSGA